MNSTKEAVIGARLSLQRALLGEISPALRAVAFSMQGRHIDVRFYYDGSISEDDLESASCAETTMLADYCPEDTVKVRPIRCDAPGAISDDGVWVYLRREVAS